MMPDSKRIARLAVALAATVVTLGLYMHQGRAEDLDAQSRALDLIQRQAVAFCSTVPLHGKSTSIDLNGKAKADLDGLIRKLADLGFDAPEPCDQRNTITCCEVISRKRSQTIRSAGSTC